MSTKRKKEFLKSALVKAKESKGSGKGGCGRFKGKGGAQITVGNMRSVVDLDKLKERREKFII